MKLALQQLNPVQQDAAFETGEIDIGFTRALTAEQSTTFTSRVLYRDPMLAVLPRSRAVQSKRVRIADLANESLILFHREGYPGLFDTTTAMCQRAGFYPRVENHPHMLQAVLSLVEAEQGVSIVPACTRNLRANGVRFYRLQPDDVRVELVAAWKKENPSVVLRAFLELIDTNAPQIRSKAELTLASIILQRRCQKIGSIGCLHLAASQFLQRERSEDVYDWRADAFIGNKCNFRHGKIADNVTGDD